MKSLRTTLQSIKEYIQKRDKTLNHVIFFDRYGEVAFVSDKPENEWQELIGEMHCSGRPTFEILSISADGNFITGQSHEEYQNGIDDDMLQSEIEEADTARDVFYKECADQFGPTAYPKGVYGLRRT